MRSDRLTVKAQEIIQDAETLAYKYNHSSIDTEHVLLALLSHAGRGIIPPLIDKLGVNREMLKSDIEKSLKDKPSVYGDSAQIHLSSEVSRIFNKAEVIAGKSEG